MDVKSIIDIINGVGFPIATCIALFWLYRENLKTTNKLLTELEMTLKTNTDVLRQVNEQMRVK